MEDIDVIVYAGRVTTQGYLNLSELLDKNIGDASKSVFFVPITVGGDPSAGYRMSRALGHHYPEDVRIGIPSICKSAGTLMCIGGSHLVVGDRGELGPLDIQLNSKDELMGLSSGLDILQALLVLQEHMNTSFRSNLYDLKFNGKLGTRLASDIACSMATGLIAPIAQQIDPVKLGETQRLINIASAYGERLNKKFNNTSKEQIERLLWNYPAHGFVIDRKEISELFKNVSAPNETENLVFEFIYRYFGSYGFEVANNSSPKVLIFKLSELINLNSPNIPPTDGEERQNDETIREQPSDSGVETPRANESAGKGKPKRKRGSAGEQ